MAVNAGNSMLTKLAKATKNDVIIDGSDAKKLNNIGLLLGTKIMVDVVKNVSGEIKNDTVKKIIDK